jgi:AAA+ superfamily predicted ATPase
VTAPALLSVASSEPVAALAAAFGLSPLEHDLVVVLLELATSGAARRLRPGGARVGDLVDALAARHRPAEILAAVWPASPLVRRGLVEVRGDGPQLDRAIAIADELWPRLVGAVAPGVPAARSVPADRLAALALDAATRAQAAELVAWMRSGADAWPLVALVGAPGSGRAELAAAMAGAIGVPVLAIAAAELALPTVPRWSREATLQQAALVVLDADLAPADALAALARDAEAPILATTTRRGLAALLALRGGRRLEVPPLDDDRRAEVWRCALAEAGAAAGAVDERSLAARYAFSPARIHDVARAAVAESAAPTTAQVAALCRSISVAEVDGLADVVELSHRWSDLVLAPATRRELELVATWYAQRGALFGPAAPARRVSGPGLACLFHGPPGTGKSMAAQVIAREVGADLLRVDLSRVVDKYIGETEKRLDRLFREAEAAGAVLFFDEADALFGTRTEVRDARDRYANLETGFLLQRLEGHRGLTLLATNLERNLDAAFQRRFAIIAEFRLPEPTERRALWERMLPDERAADVDLDFLTARMPLAGGNIRNAVLAATLLAARDGEALAMKHLVIAMWRELGKAGRFLAEHELGRWHAVVAAYAAWPRG